MPAGVVKEFNCGTMEYATLNPLFNEPLHYKSYKWQTSVKLVSRFEEDEQVDQSHKNIRFESYSWTDCFYGNL